MTGVIDNHKGKNNRTNTATKRVVRALLGLGIVLMMLLGGAYLLRNVLAKNLLEHLAQEQHLQVTCLDMDVDWQVNIYINKLCAELPDFNATLQNAKWLRSENNLTIDSVQVQHLDNPTIKTDKGTDPASLDFQLPANLPTVAIDKLSIASPLLAKKIQLAVVLNSSGTLELSGDLAASLQLQDKNWHAEVEWNLADVIKILPAAQALQQQYSDWLTDDVANSARFVSSIDFDGSQLKARHRINFDRVLAFPQCNAHVQMVGTFATTLPQPFVTPTVDIDLSALHSTLDLSGCDALPEQLASWQLKRFNLAVPKAIYVDFQQVKLPELQVSANTEHQEQEQKQLLLKDISYDFNGALDVTYSLNIEQQLHTFEFASGQLTLSSTGQLSAVLPENKPFGELQWTLNEGEIHLGLQQVSKAKLTLQQLVADIKLSGSDDKGMQLSAVLQAEDFQGFDFALAKWHSTLDMSLDADKKVLLTLDNQLQQPGYQQFNATGVDNHLSFSAMLSGKPLAEGLHSLSQLNMQADSVVSKLQSPDVQMLKLSNQIHMQGNDIDELQFKLLSQLNNIQFAGVKLNKLNNQLNVSLLKLADADFSGKTDINGIAMQVAGQPLLLKPVNIEHQGHTGFTLDSSYSEHNIVLEQAIKANVQQQQQLLSVQLEQQSITDLQPLISQLSPDLTVTQGKLNATMHASLNKQNNEINVDAELTLNEVDGRYAEYLFSGLSGESPVRVNSAGLQLGDTTLRLNSLNVGLPIEQITASLLWSEGALKLKDIAGSALGGTFSLKDIWLDQREQNFDVLLENIDLAQVAALQDQPGISITGYIGGKLPVSSGAQTVGIADGELLSQGGGVLTINDNPAFDSIKQQQGELAFLENYHFSQLSSKVTLKPDGWLFLDLAFYGQNPDKKQAVNFNYTHQENLFTLLETLRVANSIQDKIEQSISKGGQQ